MAISDQAAGAVTNTRAPHATYRAGDLVTTATGYPVLYEVLRLESNGLLRVRGVNWAPGYSALVGAHDVRPVTHLLTQ